MAIYPSVRITPVLLAGRICIFFQQLTCRLAGIGIQILFHTLGIEHITHLTATIDLPDIGTILKIHLSIFCPGLHTFTCAIDSCRIAILLSDWSRDIDLGIERAAHIVVATIDSTVHKCLVTPIVHVRLIHIAGRENMVTIRSTKDVVNDDG